MKFERIYIMNGTHFERQVGSYKLSSRLFIYILLVILLYISIGQLTHSIRVGYIKDWTVHVYRLADAMLFALPIFFCRKKVVVISYLLLVNIYLLSVIWYFRTYATIMPMSSYLMIDNLDGLGPSIIHSIRSKDFFIILPSLCFILYYILINRFIVKKGRTIIYSFVISVLILAGIVTSAYWPNKPTFYDKPLYNFTLEQVRSFKEFGFIHFWIYQIHFYQGVTQGEKEEAKAFMADVNNRSNLVDCDSLNSRKNLIIILVESLQSWPIKLTVQGVEVMPRTNQFLNQPETVLFPKVMPQVKDGRSSDAQLLLNTGLLPLNVGATSGLCSANNYPSLPLALKSKGYTSASIICDKKEYWNQEAMTLAYHFDKLYDNMMGNEGVEKADEHLFENAILKLRELVSPFYAQIVTLSGHAPYLKPLMDTPLKSLDLADDVKNYLIAMQYFDTCLGQFIDKLKEDSLYNNSIIVITGDHEAMPYNRYENREDSKAEDFFVPFIILNSPLSTKHSDKVIGQVDIYPSLLHAMGCCDYSFQGLGESVFGDNISDYAVYRTGIAAGGVNLPDSVKQYRTKLWKISDILLRMDYFR